MLSAENAQPGTTDLHRYQSPYEGNDAPAKAMQAYLNWEYELVAQLARDGAHHFKVI